jgi:hypothetical protein
VGIFRKDWSFYIGEWNQDKLHGIAKKEERFNWHCYWGQFKDDMEEGFITFQRINENDLYSQ